MTRIGNPPAPTTRPSQEPATAPAPAASGPAAPPAGNTPARAGRSAFESPSGRQAPVVLTPPQAPATQAATAPTLQGYRDQLAALPLAAADRHLLDTLLSGPKEGFSAPGVKSLLDATRPLGPAAQLAVARGVLRAPKDSLLHKAMGDLVSSREFQALSPQQQAQCCAVLGEADASVAHRLGEALKDGSLLKTDSRGGTLLSHLERLATQPLNPHLPAERAGRDRLLSGLLDEVGSPEEINQGLFGTCTVASLQYELVRDNPAEYARLVTGLLSQEGKVQLAGGQWMKLQPEYFQANAHTGDRRSTTEAVFQGAAMARANGFDDYDAAKDESTHRLLGVLPVPYGGLRGDQLRDISTQLFNERYTNDSGNSRQQLELLRRYSPDGPAKAPIIGSFQLGNNLFERHAMTFVKVQDGRVYFRNPQADGAREVKTLRPEPTEGKGMCSMSEADFRRTIRDLTVPKSLVQR